MVRLFSHWFTSNTVAQALFDAVLLFLSVVLAAFWLHRGNIPDLLQVAPDALLFAITMMVLNAVVGLYHRNPGRSLAKTIARVVIAILLALPVAWVIFKVLPSEPWHSALQIAVPLAFVFLTAVRGALSHAGWTPIIARRVLVVGTGPEAAAVRDAFDRLGPGMTLVGFYPTQKTEPATRIAAEDVLPAGAGLVEAVDRHLIDEVIVAVADQRGGVLSLRDLLDCKLSGIRVLDMPSFYERTSGEVRLDGLRASWLIFGDGFRQGWLRAFVKRTFDVSVTLVLLLLALPLMIVSAAAIVLESGFPVFYRQERVGQAGRLFHVIKFRSMRTDAERDGTPRWATSNDNRITRVGRVLRALRIDELPQFINVLKGDMSLVGPRPERPFFVDQLARDVRFYAVRHSVKPGITGWAQVRFRYGASVEDAVRKLQYDLYYVKNNTLFLDVVILFETVGVVLTGHGAH
jgi:sugar transferase (PEP-CTERM system associated)